MSRGELGRWRRRSPTSVDTHTPRQVSTGFVSADLVLLSALEDGKLLTKGYNVKHQCSMHNDEEEFVEQPSKEQHDGQFHRANVASCSSARQGFSRQFPQLTSTGVFGSKNPLNSRD